MVHRIENGEVYATGGNNFGQLGIGTKLPTDAPRKLSTFDGIKIAKIACKHHSAALSETGDLYIWGTGVFGEYLLPHKITFIPVPVSDMTLGGCFGIALDTKGALWAWGTNTSGELGLGDFEPRAFPYPILGIEDQKISFFTCGTGFTVVIVNDELEGGTVGTIKRGNTLTSKKLGESNLETLTEGGSRQKSGTKLLEVMKKEKDYFESSLIAEREEKRKAEEEASELRMQVRDLMVEMERMRGDIGAAEELARMEELKRRVEHENMVLKKEVETQQAKAEKFMLELELIHKDFELFKHRSQADIEKYMEETTSLKRANAEVETAPFITKIVE